MLEFQTDLHLQPSMRIPIPRTWFPWNAEWGRCLCHRRDGRTLCKAHLGVPEPIKCWKMYALKIELKTQPSQWQILNAAAIAWEHMDNKWKQTCATCDGVCSAHHTSAQHQKSTISTILSSLMHLTLFHVLNPCDEQENSLNLLSRRGETAGFWCASSQHLRTFNALGLISGKHVAI